MTDHRVQRSRWILVSVLVGSLAGAGAAAAQSPAPGGGCEALPDHAALRKALQSVVKGGKEATTGLGNDSWAVVVDRDGLVCAVAFSGADRSAQWPGSRVIAAQKASTANALSLPAFALSTANLYAAAQPGGSLYSLATSAPPNADAVYGGKPSAFGQPDDPMVGKAIGGVIVFGGGLALYHPEKKLVGGLGVSGDTSCADHVVAWKLRDALNLDAVPMGVAPGKHDNMILDLTQGASASGFGHPACKGGVSSDAAIQKLPQEFPIGPKK